VPHASLHKHLRCQTVASRAFGDKGLFPEVSKQGASTKGNLPHCLTSARHRSRHGGEATIWIDAFQTFGGCTIDAVDDCAYGLEAETCLLDDAAQ
jgi:hypothetical protein